jgi:hypothetical protein
MSGFFIVCLSASSFLGAFMEKWSIAFTSMILLVVYTAIFTGLDNKVEK